MSHPGSACRLNKTGSLMFARVTAKMPALGCAEALHDACRLQTGRPFHCKTDHADGPRLSGSLKPLRRALHAESPKSRSNCRETRGTSHAWAGGGSFDAHAVCFAADSLSGVMPRQYVASRFSATSGTATERRRLGAGIVTAYRFETEASDDRGAFEAPAPFPPDPGPCTPHEAARHLADRSRAPHMVRCAPRT